eukprot:Partr_v1_DN22300_c0_g1_i1_m59355 putative 6,7-dimethyl-8-ribityllumazine synthase
MVSGGLTLPSNSPDGSKTRVCIVHTRWNKEIIDQLIKGCTDVLREKLNCKSITLIEVAGSYELPFACQKSASSGRYDVVVAIGVLIKGSTMHFEYIAEAVSHGLMRVQLDTRVPVIFGLLTCLTQLQAQERAGMTADGLNHGSDWAYAAIEMANLNVDPK